LQSGSVSLENRDKFNIQALDGHQLISNDAMLPSFGSCALVHIQHSFSQVEANWLLKEDLFLSHPRSDNVTPTQPKKSRSSIVWESTCPPDGLLDPSRVIPPGSAPAAFNRNAELPKRQRVAQTHLKTQRVRRSHKKMIPLKSLKGNAAQRN